MVRVSWDFGADSAVGVLYTEHKEELVENHRRP
jgi:hypothetical protein